MSETNSSPHQKADASFAGLIGTPAVETPVVETPVVETPAETPIVETPVVETPANPLAIQSTDEPKDAPPAAPEITVEQLQARAKELGFETIDELLDPRFVSKAKEYDSIKDASDKYKSDNDMLLEEFKNSKTPFASEEMFKINHLVQNNENIDITSAAKIVTSNLSEMNNLEALVFNAKLEDPQMPERIIKNNLIRKFGVDSWEDLMETEDAGIKDYIDAEAFQAKKSLDKYNVSDVTFDKDAKTPEKVREILDKKSELTEDAKAKIEETWSPLVKNYQESLTEHAINIPDKDGKMTQFTTYKINADEAKHYSDLAMQIAKQSGMTELNEKNVTYLRNVLQDRITLDKLPTLFKIAIDKAKSDAQLEYEQERDNPGGGSEGADGTKPTPVKKKGISMDSIGNQHVKYARDQ